MSEKALDELLTTNEAAQRVNVPAATLRFWRHQSRGPRSFRLGRRVMYKAADLDRWVQAQYESGTGGVA